MDNNFDFNDDGMTDRLDYLADRHADFFEWLELLFEAPDVPPDWQEFVSEPSPSELEQMNRTADELVRDIMNMTGKDSFKPNLDWIWDEENW
jgi:hypothetical protein